MGFCSEAVFTWNIGFGFPVKAEILNILSAYLDLNFRRSQPRISRYRKKEFKKKQKKNRASPPFPEALGRISIPENGEEDGGEMDGRIYLNSGNPEFLDTGKKKN